MNLKDIGSIHHGSDHGEKNRDRQVLQHALQGEYCCPFLAWNMFVDIFLYCGAIEAPCDLL